MLSKGEWESMSDEKEREAEIIDAHQELVRHIEQSTGRMRALSWLTVAVALVLSLSYVSQLILPLTGTTSATVNLTDPVVVASELLVLILALAWLYIGVRDLRFSGRMRRDIVEARSKEKEIQDRLP